MPTAEPIASLTISVFTRHSGDCPQTNPQWKRCGCRRSLYLNRAKGPGIGAGDGSAQPYQEKSR